MDDAFAEFSVIDYHFKSENSGWWKMEDASKISNKMNLSKWYTERLLQTFFLPDHSKKINTGIQKWDLK